MYLEEIKDIPPEKIAYVDECGIDTYLYIGDTGMRRGASKYSDKSVAENISVAELLPLKWETGLAQMHANIPLEILVIKRIYELFYAIELYCRIILTQIILPNQNGRLRVRYVGRSDHNVASRI